VSFSAYYLPDNTSNGMNVYSYAMAFKHEVCKGRRGYIGKHDAEASDWIDMEEVAAVR